MANITKLHVQGFNSVYWNCWLGTRRLGVVHVHKQQRMKDCTADGIKHWGADGSVLRDVSHRIVPFPLTLLSLTKASLNKKKLLSSLKLFSLKMAQNTNFA